MKISRGRLRRIIREELEEGDMLDHAEPDEVEAREDAWAGGENLSNPIDHPKAAGGEATTTAPETLKLAERKIQKFIKREMKKLLAKK